MSDPESPFDAGASPQSPRIEISLGEDSKAVLTWHNTLVRRFKVGNGQYDHVICVLGEDEDNVSVLRPDSEFLDYLIGLNFPHRVDPVLDEAAIACVSSIEMLEFEEELADGIEPN